MASSRTIGTYRLVAGLGQGGMARVYLALVQKSAGFQKLFVLKVLRGDLASDSEFLQMFLQEARLTARLNHPNVVQTYEIGSDGGQHFIAMEYLEGQSLSTVSARVARDELSLPVHLRILCDALEGLHYAHELTDFDGTPLGIVHRDVSPQNVLVTYSGVTKLVDFGIAKVAGITQTQQGTIKGKTGYMAPEQAACLAVDRRSDVFAVGVMLWEALTGRRLVQRSDDEFSALARRITGSEPKVRAVAPDAPEGLAAICDRAMAVNPAERFATAADMRDAILAWVDEHPPAADARAVSSLLQEHFASDRTEIRKIIEEQVKLASEAAPLIDLFTKNIVATPSVDGLVLGVTDETRVLTPPPRRRRWSVAAAASAGAALLVAASLFAVRRYQAPDREAASPARSAVDAQPDAASSTVAVEPPRSPTVRVTLDVVPETASVTIDGTAVSGPIVELPRDDAEHVVRAVAPGHLPTEQKITLDGDRAVSLKMKRAISPATPVPKPASEPKRPRRSVDEGDPYR